MSEAAVENWDRIKDVFSEALEMPADDRAAYLARECGDDTKFREEVEGLLAAHAKGAERITGFTLDPDDAIPRPRLMNDTMYQTPPPQDSIGTSIGPYKLIEVIAEGGMGVVYKAEQRTPVRRLVALKLIKLGMDSKQVIARFESERQALALINHRNVAAVYDAGTSDRGRPYFVMEYVAGEPITNFCDRHNYTNRQRLELFIQACDAIQHAHTKAIIHRDIKPGNILVTLEDNQPIVKVIDFGVAKATSHRLTDQTMFTEAGQLIGTPEYMSPEQAEMNQLDIDTRTDIYSLGVVLYELLAGALPFDSKTLRDAAYSKIQQIIREDDPPRPSTRLSSLGAGAAEEVAKHRQMLLPSLEKELRSELEWIPLKALRKDRSQRYHSPAEMAQDIRNYLEQRPLLAGPESSVYRLKKFVRRHRFGVLAAGGIAAALAIGLTLATMGFISASRERDSANQARAAADEARVKEAAARKEAEENAARADREAKIATAVSHSLQGMLELANPDAGKGPNYTVRQMLDDFAQTFADQLKDRPEAEADLQGTIGMAYSRQGLNDRAMEHLGRAVRLRRETVGKNDVKFADSLVDLAWGQIEGREQGRAIRNLRDALRIYQAQNTSGRQVLRAMQYLQLALFKSSQNGEAVDVANQAIALAAKQPSEEFPEIANIYHMLAETYQNMGNGGQAEALARKAIEMHVRLHGPTHPETGWGYYILADILRRQGKYDEAVEFSKKALVTFRAAYPPEHWSIARTLRGLEDSLTALSNNAPLGEGVNTPKTVAEVADLYRPSLAARLGDGTREEGWNDEPKLIAVKVLAGIAAHSLKLSDYYASQNQTDLARTMGSRADALLIELKAAVQGSPELTATMSEHLTAALVTYGRWQEGMELAQQLIDLKVSDPNALDMTAWALTCIGQPKRPQVELAQQLSKSAIELSPFNPLYKITLMRIENLLKNAS